MGKLREFVRQFIHQVETVNSETEKQTQKIKNDIQKLEYKVKKLEFQINNKPTHEKGDKIKEWIVTDVLIDFKRGEYGFTCYCCMQYFYEIFNTKTGEKTTVTEIV